MKEYKFLSEGRNRIVFQHGNWVVKIARNENGISDNWEEEYLFKRYGSRGLGYVCYARCRIVSKYQGNVLIMELLDIDVPYNLAPDWVKCVDCYQVGYNKKREIVAFDFGRN